MKYFCIDPEVAGGLGGETIIETRKTPPLVTSLHYTFEGWLGDEILQSFPCYIVSRGLANDIEANELSGVLFGDVKVDVSETFKDLYPDRPLPPFVWMKVTGREGADDFFLSSDSRLVVSENAWRLIKPRAHNCKVTQLSE